MTDNMQAMFDVQREKARRRRSLWRKIPLLILLFLVVSFTTLSILFGGANNFCRLLGLGAVLVQDKVERTPPFGGKRQVNILVLGVDVDFGGNGASRSDSMKFIHVDLDKSLVSMLSIPRDTWVDIPGHGHNRINAAYELGGAKEANRLAISTAAAEALLTQYAGEPVHVDHYVRIQTGGFVKIVDALGGIDINVEKKMDYEDPSQDLFIHLTPGMQHLNGTQAMGYIRFRHDAESDYGRIRRQDQFVRTLASQLRDPEKSRKLSMIGPLMSMVKTDLSANDVLALKSMIDKVGLDGIQSATLPTTPTYKGAASVVEVNEAEAPQVIHETLYGPRPTVAVLNGTHRAGLASDAGDRIDQKIFNVVAVGTTKAPAAVTTVIASERNKASAQALVQQLGLTCQVDTKSAPPAAVFGNQDTPKTTPQILVILGDDFSRTLASSQLPTP